PVLIVLLIGISYILNLLELVSTCSEASADRQSPPTAVLPGPSLCLASHIPQGFLTPEGIVPVEPEITCLTAPIITLQPLRCNSLT
ncbi:MAG TPA: hypothetical protein PK528_06755, partial [Syntrophorhabdus sp.]|nr:hypothetical protein [Syntrophorhabdus sp.]